MRGATCPTTEPDFHNVISIHAPHARSDDLIKDVTGQRFGFQSTLLMRGATCECGREKEFNKSFQSTLLMRGATAQHKSYGQLQAISIHAPHARSDSMAEYIKQACKEFQSTLLMRGATVVASAICVRAVISIHAPHARSDSSRISGIVNSWYFNPRSSCEERPARRRTCLLLSDFNPRSSCEERRSLSAASL